MKKRDRRKKKRLPGILILLVLTEIIVLVFAGYTAARYVLQKKEMTVAEASEFYFTSDLLRETTGDVPVYYIDPQNADFQIKLYNSADSQRVTSAEIEYTVEVTNGAADKTNGTIKGGIAGASPITVTPDKDAKEAVEVTVTTTKPYARTLSAAFTLALGNQYSIEDAEGNIAAVLTMNCTDDAKTVKLSLPEGVIPDNTNDRVEKEGEDYRFQSSGHEVYSIVLLKKDSGMNLSKSFIPFADEINIGNGS